MKIDSSIKNLIRQALKEDIGKGDITTNVLVSADAKAKAVIIVKQNGIIAGLDIAKAVFTELDKGIKFKSFVKDGDKVQSGKKIVEIRGEARAILTAERTALNFLGHLSGIATLTRQFVDEARPCKAEILDTRKTMPLMRILEKYAVKCGGGANHRMGLWDAVLIKDNHIVVHSPRSTVHRLKKMVMDVRKKMPKNMPIEIEVTNLNEFKDAIEAHPNIILLDNMSINQIKKAVQIRNIFLQSIDCGLSTILLEVSGGVNLSNIRQIAKAGVERISIGALTHSAKALDISLSI